MSTDLPRSRSTIRDMPGLQNNLQTHHINFSLSVSLTLCMPVFNFMSISYFLRITLGWPPHTITHIPDQINEKEARGCPEQLTLDHPYLLIYSQHSLMDWLLGYVVKFFSWDVMYGFGRWAGQDAANFYNLWFETCKMFEKSGSPINTFTAQTRGEWVVMTQKTETFVLMTRWVKPILLLSAKDAAMFGFAEKVVLWSNKC